MEEQKAKNLHEIQKAALERATIALKKHGTQDAQAELQLAQACDEVLRLTRKPDRLWPALAFIAAMTISIVTILRNTHQGWPLDAPVYGIDVKVDFLRLHFEQSVDVEMRLPAGRMEVVNADSYLLAGESKPLASATRVLLRGKEIRAGQLVLKPRGVLSFDAQQSALVIHARGENISTEIQVSGPDAHMLVESKDDGSFPYPLTNSDTTEFVTFRAQEHSPDSPVSFTMRAPGPWEVAGLRPSKIEFSKQSFINGQEQFVSSVLEGKVRILDIERDVEISRGDQLTLSSVEIKRMVFSGTNNGIHVRLEAQAGSIHSGPSGFSTDLTPTFLDSISKNKKTQTLLSVLMSVALGFWGLRGLLLSRK